MWKSLIVILFCVHNAYLDDYDEPEEIKLPIVGLFSANERVQEKAFNECITSANHGNIKLIPTTLKPYRNDSYSAWRTLCKNSKEQNLSPIAVVGPQYGVSDGAIKDQCALMNVPHIQATWQPIDTEDDSKTVEDVTSDMDTEQLFKNSISLNFYPNEDDISRAYANLLRYYDWKNFAVLYEDEFGLMRIQKILSEHTDKYPLIIRRLDPKGDNKHIFKHLAKAEESRVLLDCNVDNILKYMEEATALKMVNEYQHYILTSMDAATLVDKLEVLSCNITWLSVTNFDNLVDYNHYLSTRVGGWIGESKETIHSPPLYKMKLNSLLMDDIARHVTNALNLIDPDSLTSHPPLNICGDSSEPWVLGGEFLKNLMQNQTTGVTGPIMFDNLGRRINYTLYVNEIHVQKRLTIGLWESATKGAITILERPPSQINQQKNKHFTIISQLAKPYCYYKEDNHDEYEGFSVELADSIFGILKEMGYNYTHSFAKNLEGKGYGKYNPTIKKWDGLIGDLLSKQADLAIGDLTITEERKKVVDFSVPIMTLGISILYKKEHEVPPDTFSFLHPYSFQVWMYTATAYCLVSIVLFICSRISPADWENPQPCDKDPEELENIWNFKNCTWLTMGSIMTQGCDILPKAIGSRWVCGMWWFFALIVCQTYIAQLAASLTSAMEDEPINSVEDLARQSKILYGVVSGGSTYGFFKNSKDKMYQKMFENMEANPVVFVKTNDEGEQLVLKSRKGFAFFMESSTIEYKLRRNCDLKKVGGELDSKDYGIAMPSNSPFRSHINMAILRLKELTKLDAIKKTWWEKKFDAKTDCEDETQKDDLEGSLQMKHLIGAFYVLVVGLVFCLFVTAAEFMNEIRNIVVREQVTHKEAFVKELKASLNFAQSQKPVLKNPSRAPSVASSLNSDDRQASRAASVADFINFEKTG